MLAAEHGGAVEPGAVDGLGFLEHDLSFAKSTPDNVLAGMSFGSWAADCAIGPNVVEIFQACELNNAQEIATLEAAHFTQIKEDIALLKATDARYANLDNNIPLGQRMRLLACAKRLARALKHLQSGGEANGDKLFRSSS